MSFTTVFGEHPDVRVLEFLAGHAEFDYNLTDLARNAGVSRPAAYRVVERLTDQELLVRTRRVGTSWFYALNDTHPMVRPLLDFEVRIAESPGSQRPARAQEVNPS